MKRASRLNLNNILFSIFWWFIQKISPKRGERLLYWGLESGAFPNRSREDEILGINLFGHHFNTPIGVAAGFGKYLNIVDDLIFMGAGFGEFGPFTMEKEDVLVEKTFLPRDKAIITQSLGYNNIGILNMLSAFVSRRYLPSTVGINITITAESEDENVKQGRIMPYQEEFEIMVRKIAPYCDFITVNFSHPDTELSRLISDGSLIIPLLLDIKRVAQAAAPIHPPKILAQIPLHLNQTELPMVCHHLMHVGIDGIIVGGTLSLAHEQPKLSKPIHAGLLSGAPTKRYILDMISKVHQYTKGNVPIIALDGVFTGQDAYDFLAVGASLIQLDTVLRYEGPKAVTRINRDLATILRHKGLKSVKEAIGIDFN